MRLSEKRHTWYLRSSEEGSLKEVPTCLGRRGYSACAVLQSLKKGCCAPELTYLIMGSWEHVMGHHKAKSQGILEIGPVATARVKNH